MSNDPLPQRQLPVLDRSGNFVLTWYRWLQGLKVVTGPEGPQGETGKTGPAGPAGTATGTDALSFVALGLLDGSNLGLVSISSTTGDLTVGGNFNSPTLTVNSAPKWTTARTLSFSGAATGSASVDGSANVVTALANPIATTFGAGAPSTLVGEGALYFDTTLATYVGYVQHSSAWHQIA